MVKIQFLTILLVVTCFLGDVVSVTDKELEVSTVHCSKVMFTIIVSPAEAEVEKVRNKTLFQVRIL